MSDVIDLFFSSSPSFFHLPLSSALISTLPPPLRLCLPCLQASRPVGVGFCDGNHGPRQPLCLQRSRKRGRLHERPRGANSSRAGHHRNCPQSFSGHICLHLHLRHLRFPWTRDAGIVPNSAPHFPPSSSSIYILGGFDYAE